MGNGCSLVAVSGCEVRVVGKTVGRMSPLRRGFSVLMVYRISHLEVQPSLMQFPMAPRQFLMSLSQLPMPFAQFLNTRLDLLAEPVVEVTVLRHCSAIHAMAARSHRLGRTAAERPPHPRG